MKSTLSECCKKPVYMDVANSGEILGESACVKLVYVCSGCGEICGAVVWGDA